MTRTIKRPSRVDIVLSGISSIMLAKKCAAAGLKYPVWDKAIFIGVPLNKIPSMNHGIIPPIPPPISEKMITIPAIPRIFLCQPLLARMVADMAMRTLSTP